MEAYIPLICMAAVAIVACGIFVFGFHIDQNNLRTWIYAATLLLVGVILGFATYYNNKSDNLSLANSYMWLQAFFLLAGVFHLWFMYRKLFWSKRDGYSKSRDSFLPELVYTIFLAALTTVGILIFMSVKGDAALAGMFWAVGAPFLAPFLFIKTFDAINQVPSRDFSKKWAFTKEPIREDNWQWVNEMWIEFEVYQNWANERLRAGRKARFRIRAPREAPLREVFRLAVREYNRKGPEIVAQDLGFEPANDGRFWWLFSIKFFWNQPNTWFRTPRYLDPYEALVAGEAGPKDVIVARRMLVAGAKAGEDEGDVAMGEL